MQTGVDVSEEAGLSGNSAARTVNSNKRQWMQHAHRSKHRRKWQFYCQLVLFVYLVLESQSKSYPRGPPFVHLGQVLGTCGL